MILFLPFGAASGFASVTLGFIGKEHGLSDGQVAALAAAALVPNVWKLLWAPVADTTLTRRRWYLGSSVVAALTLASLGLVPIEPETVHRLEVLIIVNGVAVTFLGMTVDALVALCTPIETRGRAAGWLQAGNLGGSGIGGGAGLWLATRVGIRPAAALVGAALLCCALALLWVPEPARERHAGGLRRALVEVARDVWRTILTRRSGVLALLLCLLPVGSAAASALFSAIAGRWSTPADAVALYTGLLGGVAAALGCLAGGRLSDAMDRKAAYALTGLFLAAVAVGMWAAPRNQAAYAGFTLAYQFGAGVSYGAFTGFVLEAIGHGAVATKYNALASVSNVPIYLMTRLDGWASDRFGAGPMLLVDAATEVLGAVAFMALSLLLVGRVARRRDEAPDAVR